MNSAWPMEALDVLLVRSEEQIDLQPDATYRQVTVRLKGNGVVERGKVLGSEIAAERQYVVRTNQFIISRIDARNGASGLIPPKLDGAIVTNDFPVFNVNQARLLPDYLKWLSKTAWFVEICKRGSEGTTNRVRLKEDRFLAKTIPLPPLSEQRRIVARIEELAGKIAEAKRLQSAADENLCHFISSLHCKLSENREIVASDFLDLHEDQEAVAVDISYPQIGVWGFGGGLFKKLAVKRDETTYRYFNRIFSGALVLSQVKGWEGAIGIASDDLDGWYVSPEYRTFRCKPAEADPNYLRYLVTTPWFWSKLKTLTRGVGARRERTRPDHFLKMRLPMPTIDRQREVIPLLKKLDALDGLRATSELDALLPSILDKAFRGEL
jgi:type I restriction enzyme S subunit